MLCAAKVLSRRCPSWDKSGKARRDQMLSAFTPLATFERTCRDVCVVPTTEVASLFDLLVGAEKERWRNLYAQGPRCRRIDDQFKRRRLLNRQIAGLGTF